MFPFAITILIGCFFKISEPWLRPGLGVLLRAGGQKYCYYLDRAIWRLQQPNRAGVKPAHTTDRPTLMVGAGFIPARK